MFKKNGKSQSLGLVKSGSVEQDPAKDSDKNADKKTEVKVDTKAN